MQTLDKPIKAKSTGGTTVYILAISEDGQEFLVAEESGYITIKDRYFLRWEKPHDVH